MKQIFENNELNKKWKKIGPEKVFPEIKVSITTLPEAKIPFPRNTEEVEQHWYFVIYISCAQKDVYKAIEKKIMEDF